MKIINHLNKSTKSCLSYEIVPPQRGKSIQEILNIVEKLVPYNPSWIDVTAHSSTCKYNELEDGTIEKRVIKKRPGTIGICGVIQNRFNIDTVAHLLCRGFTKEETEDALLELGFLGIHNILALRGDGLNYKKIISKERTINNHAVDLVKQIKDLNQGLFLDNIAESKTVDFGIGVASYPEKHFESPNLQQDINYLKEKIDSGAEYTVTQMFYDNSNYFDFVKQCRIENIKIPIVPGLKILKSVKQLTSIPKNFYINFPNDLVQEVMQNQKHVQEIGIRHAVNQAKELLKNGAPGIHFYIMEDVDLVLQVVKKLF